MSDADKAKFLLCYRNAILNSLSRGKVNKIEGPRNVIKLLKIDNIKTRLFYIIWILLYSDSASYSSVTSVEVAIC